MKNFLVVDVQSGFVFEGNKDTVIKIDKYLKENNFDNVIYTKFIQNKLDSRNHLYSYGLYEKEEKKIVVKKIANSKYFSKRTHGLTVQILNYFERKNIKEVEICGIDNMGSIDLIETMLKNKYILTTKLNDLICASSKSKPKKYSEFSTSLPTIHGIYISDIYCNNKFNLVQMIFNWV